MSSTRPITIPQPERSTAAPNVPATDPGGIGKQTARSPLRNIRRRVGHLLRQQDGPLTRKLLRGPGRFGLGQLPRSAQPDATATVVCGYCSTGCGLNVHLREGQAINLTATTEYPVNLGMACPKGWESLSVLDARDRATTPYLRDDHGRLKPVDWDTALRTFRDRIQEIQRQHGPESVAFLSTGQIPSEEMALLGCLAKFGMGLRHGDGNTRQCMATSVVAYKESFGFDAPPYTYADFEQSDVLVFVGANPCVAHPIMWQRVCRNRNDPKIIVIDPRRTETAMAASQHLAIRPKSDLTLFYGIANLLIKNRWIDEAYIRAHTSGFEDFSRHVADYPVQRVVEATGLDPSQLEQLADAIHTGNRVSFWWTMGVNQSYEGVRTAQSIINLALMTGNIGRPGTGANSITGQCNAMGSRLFSNTTNLLGGHDFTNTNDRRKVAEALQIDETVIPNANSWSYNEIIEGILRDRIKGLWVIATNTAHSWINQNTAHEILDRLDFLVVQNMYRSTETASRADLILPAAGWGEKEGTFINSERRIGLIKKISKAPGDALADFHIFKLIARYWGCDKLFQRWRDPESVFQILKEVTRGQPCDITGIRDYRMLDDYSGIQWPYPEAAPPDAVGNGEAAAAIAPISVAGPVPSTIERRLFEDGRFYHADGLARFLFESPRKMPEPPSRQYPLLLLTGRGTVSQWHTQTRTGKSAVLRKLYPKDVYVEINPCDARPANIKPNAEVIVESQRGRIRARAFVTLSVPAGSVFLPMHYHVTNKLTHAHFDPYSKQPSYKDCAVRVRAADSHESTR